MSFLSLEVIKQRLNNDLPPMMLLRDFALGESFSKQAPWSPPTICERELRERQDKLPELHILTIRPHLLLECNVLCFYPFYILDV